VVVGGGVGDGADEAGLRGVKVGVRGWEDRVGCSYDWANLGVGCHLG